MNRVTTLLLAFVAVLAFMVATAEAGHRYYRRGVVSYYAPVAPLIGRPPVTVHHVPAVPYVYGYPGVIPFSHARVYPPYSYHSGSVYGVPTYGTYYGGGIHLGTSGIRLSVGY